MLILLLMLIPMIINNGADADTDNFTDANADAVTDNGARRILGPPLHQVDSQPLRCPLGPEEKRKVSR